MVSLAKKWAGGGQVCSPCNNKNNNLIILIIRLWLGAGAAKIFVLIYYFLLT